MSSFSRETIDEQRAFRYSHTILDRQWIILGASNARTLFVFRKRASNPSYFGELIPFCDFGFTELEDALAFLGGLLRFGITEVYPVIPSLLRFYSLSYWVGADCDPCHNPYCTVELDINEEFSLDIDFSALYDQGFIQDARSNRKAGQPIDEYMFTEKGLAAALFFKGLIEF